MAKIKNYQAYPFEKITLVLCSNDRRDANFGNTGYALCGILGINETLDDFIDKREARIKILAEVNAKIII